MKTHVIQLENDDDYISVRDKMNWSQTRRILLIYPPAGSNLSHPLDLTLIKRHASALGAQLAMVTMDPKIKLAVRHVSIPVFENILLAQEGEWQVNTHEKIELRIKNPMRVIEKMRTLGYVQQKPESGLSITRIIMFFLAVLALIALGIYILPGASPRINLPSVFQSFHSTLHSHPTEKQLGPSCG